jgi:two-component system, LuxR family, sensor kinase FixL
VNDQATATTAVLPRPLVLVIEDDEDARSNLCDILGLDGYRVETAGTVAAALNRSNWADIAIIILDYRLPDGNAETLLPVLRDKAPHADVVVSTGVGGLAGAILAVRQGAADYIVKPLDAGALRASLARIAERQKLASAKERSEAAFRTLVEAAPCMIVILRSDHAILYFSPYAESLTGYAAAEVLNKEFFSVFIPDPILREEISKRKAALLNGVPTRGFQCPIVCKNGTERWIMWNVELLPQYDQGQTLLAVGQDITSVKQAQEQALQSERLAAIGQMMAGLAHESGNALARSQACLEMLTFAVENQPKALNLIARIQAAQDHLKQLYDDVRNYAAPLKLDFEDWYLPAVWRQSWENLAVLRSHKSGTLLEDLGGIDLRLQLDQFRMGQVFRNIIENALAACADPAEIKVICTRSEINGQPAIQVAFRDNGPGLNEEQRQRMFEPFYTTKTKGTGLGMAISKRIVEAHGGRIEIGSGTQTGTEIVVILPRTQQ